MRFYVPEGPRENTVGGVAYGDRAYVGYHGAAVARFHVPSLRCICFDGRNAAKERRLGRVAVRPIPPTATVMVPQSLQTAWPSLDGFPINRGNEHMRGPRAKDFSVSAYGRNGALTPEEWQLWRLRFAILCDGVVPEDLRPEARLSPISFRRSSKKPFSFLFPFASVPGAQIVSHAVRETLEGMGAKGVQFTDLFHPSDPTKRFPEVSLLEATVESPITNSILSACLVCGTTIYEAPSGLTRGVLDIDVQASAHGLLLSERVHLAIRELCEASLVPPLFREVEVATTLAG